VGTSGAIARYDGASWKKMTSGTTLHLTGIRGSSVKDLFAVGVGEGRQEDEVITRPVPA
jgi:hypothetical protein